MFWSEIFQKDSALNPKRGRILNYVPTVLLYVEYERLRFKPLLNFEKNNGCELELVMLVKGQLD